MALHVRAKRLDGGRVVHIHDRHVDNIREILAVELLYLIGRFPAFHNDLSRSACFLKYRHDKIEVTVSLVEVDEYAVLAEEERITERGYLVAGLDGDAVLEAEGAYGVESQFGNYAFAGRCPVEFGIMPDNELAVGCALEVEFYDIHAHIDSGLNGRQRVLRPSAPISPVGNDKHALTIRVKQVGTDLLCPSYILLGCT